MGIVVFKDRKILYGIYDGTTDIMSNNLSDTWNGAWKINKMVEECGCDGEDVLIYAYYGGGHTYTGRACKEHQCIIFDFNNFLESEYAYRRIWLDKSKYSNEEIENLKQRHNKILNENWTKYGNHTGIDLENEL